MDPVLTAALASALHILALGIGLGSAFVRAQALRAGDVARALAADNVYGIAALLWVATGAWRAFGSVAKGWDYYSSNAVFLTKLWAFAGVFALELWPMVSFVRWRMARGRGQVPDTSRAGLFGVMTYVEVALIVVIVFLAALMARGVGQLAR